MDDAALANDALAGMMFETLIYLLMVASAVAFATVVRHVSRQQTVLLFGR